MTQFAMVEELAFLIKDNLSCKHLVLSVEEALVDFLANDTSPDSIVELEPMSPYNRLLLHRLADIFGLAHESIGEGDGRHLVFERGPESAIPSILVSDMLWQCNEYHSPAASHQLLRRRDTLPATKESPKSFGTTLEEREAAYLAARERIFSVGDGEIKGSGPPKPRNVPVVAQRMIAHALGQRIHTNLSDMKINHPNSIGIGGNRTKTLTKAKSENHSNGSSKEEASSSPSQRALAGREVRNSSSSTAQDKTKVKKKPLNDESSNGGAAQTGKSDKVVSKYNMKEEHMGAAKRMFAHALGIQGTKDNNSFKVK